MSKLLLTCVLALVFGFVGATAAVGVLHDQLQGPAGATGAPGPTGAEGPAGKTGPAGPAGTAGSSTSAGQLKDLGTSGCAGTSVDVITAVTVTSDQKLRLTKKSVCIVK